MKPRHFFILIISLLFLGCNCHTQEITVKEDDTQSLNLIVYVEDPYISVMEDTGRKVENVTTNFDDEYVFRSPKWSPSGDRIAFLRSESNHLNSAELVVLEFSLDGNFYYDLFLETEDHSRIETNYLNTRKEIFVINLDAYYKKAPTMCHGSEVAFDWISDGRIGLVCQGESSQVNDNLALCIISVDGSTTNSTINECHIYNHPQPRKPFTSLDYSVERKEFLLGREWGENKIYTIDNSFSSVEYLIDGLGPSWSNDGAFIAYTNGRDLFVYSCDEEVSTSLYASGETAINPFELSDEEFTVEWFKNILVDGAGITWGENDKEIYFTARRYHASEQAIYKINLESLKIELLSVDPSRSPDIHSFDNDGRR